MRDLEREIKHILNTNDSSKFDIFYQSPDRFAFVLFYNVKHAEQVRYDLRGKVLASNSSDKLRIDFHDPKQFNLLRTNAKRKTRSRTRSRSPSTKSTRRVVQTKSASPKPSIINQEEEEENSKAKKSKIIPILNEPTTLSVSKTSNFENIIITKTDNVRRVDTIVLKTKSVSPPPPVPLQKEETVQSLPEEIVQEVKEPAKKQHKHHKHISNGSKTVEDRDEGEIEDEEISTNKEGLINEIYLNKYVQNRQFKSIIELKDTVEPAWSGLFTLKKNIFPNKFYFLAGNARLGEELLRNNNLTDSSTYMNLQINQRIRLDSSKSDDIEKS